MIVGYKRGPRCPICRRMVVHCHDLAGQPVTIDREWIASGWLRVFRNKAGQLYVRHAKRQDPGYKYAVHATMCPGR